MKDWRFLNDSERFARIDIALMKLVVSSETGMVKHP